MPVIGVLDHYRTLLDIPAHTQNITLLEGGTPLIPLPFFARIPACRGSMISVPSHSKDTIYNSLCVLVSVVYWIR